MSNELPPDAFDGMKWEFKNPNKDLLTNKEASKFLNIPLEELVQIREKGEIPFHINSGMYFYKKADCVAWIVKNQPERVVKK